MSVATKIGAYVLAFATAAGLGGCSTMTRGYSTGVGAIGGGVVGAMLGGRLGAVLGAAAGGVAGNMLGSDCQVNTRMYDTATTYGTQMGQYSGYANRTTKCSTTVNLNQELPAGTVAPGPRMPSGFEGMRTQSGMRIN